MSNPVIVATKEGPILGLSQDMDISKVPINTRKVINHRYTILLNDNGHGRCWVETPDTNWSFILHYHERRDIWVLAWDYPEVVPKYVKQAVYKELARHKEAYIGGDQ